MIASFTAGIESVDFNQFAPVPLTLIFKLTGHFPPSCIGYRSSLLVVFNHVSNPQVFNSNQAIFSNQFGRQLMQKIGTSIFNLSVYLSYLKSRFISVIRAFGLPTQYLLRCFKFLIQPIKILGISNLFLVTGTNQHRDTNLNPNFLIGWGQLLNVLVIYQQRNIPSTRRVKLDCYRRWHRAIRQISRPNDIKNLSEKSQ